MSHWKSLSSGILALLASAAAAYYAVTPPPSTQANGLTPERDLIDFGTSNQGQTLLADVAFTNHFVLPVQILDVSRGCSCSDAKVDRTLIPPGESVAMHIGWKTGMHRGTISEQVGLYFRLSDGQLGVSNIKLKATVQPDFDYEPRDLTFDRAESTTRTIHFQPALRPNLILSQPESNQTGITVALTADGLGLDIHFDANTPNLDGTGVFATVHTDSPNEPVVRIPIQFKGKPKAGNVPAIPMAMPAK